MNETRHEKAHHLHVVYKHVLYSVLTQEYFYLVANNPVKHFKQIQTLVQYLRQRQGDLHNTLLIISLLERN